MLLTAQREVLMQEDQWSIRIEAGRDAQTRSRLAFLACIVISVAIIIAVFNFELSWLRNFTGADPSGITAVQQELRAEARKTWLNSGRVNISLLGVNIAESDLSLIGSISLYVLTMWFFYCMRRENHLIANLLVDADQKNDREISLAAFHGIASYTVFTTIGGDEPIRAVRPSAPRVNRLPPVHWINIVLFFLPAITILVMILGDVASLFQVSPFRPSGDPLWKLLASWEWVQIAAIEAVAIFLLALTAIKCIEILKFERATEDVLREFRDILFHRPELRADS
jgi:hypothetical protein